MDDIVHNFFNKLDRKPTKKFVEEFSRSSIEEWKLVTQKIEGIEDFVEGLAKNYRLSVLSNTHYETVVSGN